MAKVYDVPAQEFISRLTEILKNEDIPAPVWSSFVKTGAHADKPPQQPDWWYTRCASIMRKIYLHGPLTVNDMSPDFQDRWATLIEDIKKYGVRNSLLTGYPPTASSSHIQGSNECFEPYTYIGYVRKTLCGEFYITCEHFTKDCISAGVYTPDLMTQVANSKGSVQSIEGLPDWIKKKYQTAWELSNKDLIDMARDRQYFIDQSQSLNHFVP